MADTVDSTTRSRMMAAIKGKNTKPDQHLKFGIANLLPSY